MRLQVEQNLSRVRIKSPDYKGTIINILGLSFAPLVNACALKWIYRFLVRSKNGFKNKKLRYFFLFFSSGIYYY
jgi:hypothetical protein